MPGGPVPEHVRRLLCHAISAITNLVQVPPVRVAIVLYTDDARLLAVATSKPEDEKDTEVLVRALGTAISGPVRHDFFDGTGRPFHDGTDGDGH